MTLHCVCGAEVWGTDDLFFWTVDGLIHGRCRKTHCRLEKILTISRERSRTAVKFSKMFADYNMLFMGRDEVERRLRELGRTIVEKTHDIVKMLI